uniref:Reverse transcriptase zinc-binding domain-containing protein n=1 Tax=Arundo donax TaxID=35708 RepID=A0A0A8ZJY0_ARUDO
MQRILDVYERASGQVINKDKSSNFFSPTIRGEMRDALLIPTEARSERYLGLPVSVGRSRKRAFEYIKQKIWARIQGWQGKEILVKAVAQAIPTYAMSCFDLTKGLCDDLSMMIGRWWWSHQDKEKIHWLSWEKLTRSKKKGGLGFWDLHLFNMAMLARQAWRILTNPDSLCARVLKAKYFPNLGLLPCTAREGISYTWRSILKGIDLLKEGIIWRIGNGRSVNIWSDPWIPRNITRKPITPRGASLLSRVEDLINPITGDWDEQLVKDTFWKEDAQAILNIPTRTEDEDWPAWHYDQKGLFSVKSAYKVAVERRDRCMKSDASGSGLKNYKENDFKWNKIWELGVQNKTKMFLWRVAHNSLPVKRNIEKRGVQLDTVCPVCKRFDEDCGHIFFKCKEATECWRRMNLEQERVALEACPSGLETVQQILNMVEEVQLKVVILMWR